MQSRTYNNFKTRERSITVVEELTKQEEKVVEMGKISTKIQDMNVDAKIHITRTDKKE